MNMEGGNKMDIADLLKGQLNHSMLNQLGQSTDASPSKVKKLVNLGMPALLQAMQRNASSTDGADALAKALDQHKEDPVDDISDFLKHVDTSDGSKILEHVFTSKNERVQKNLAKKTGLGQDQVGGLLTQLAPLVMGVLGKQKIEQGLDAKGVSGLLNQVLGQTGSSGLIRQATKILDTDKDGSIVDDVQKFLGKFLK
ncbi:MAG: DUF937 domain-containing protein [Ruminococcaceae bacterium]|nr:DUF937 domain-containing protein [Oscillospiraceae bacterium]